MAKSGLKIRVFSALLVIASIPLYAEPPPIVLENEQEADSDVQQSCAAIQEWKDQRQSVHRQGGGTSSYVGTTTGPGPNGGYASTPRGTYQTDSSGYSYSNRDN